MSPAGDDATFRHPVRVRFRDVDIGGHAHHSQPLVYFEEARAAYWRDVVGRPGVEDIDYILAEARLRYHGRIFYPARLAVSVRVTRLGKKHFEMTYRVADDGGDLLVSGHTVQVMYDYEAGSSKPIPAEVRERIETQDGPFGPGGRPVED